MAADNRDHPNRRGSEEIDLKIGTLQAFLKRENEPLLLWQVERQPRLATSVFTRNGGRAPWASHTFILSIPRWPFPRRKRIRVTSGTGERKVGDGPNTASRKCECDDGVTTRCPLGRPEIPANHHSFDMRIHFSNKNKRDCVINHNQIPHVPWQGRVFLGLLCHIRREGTRRPPVVSHFIWQI